MSRQGFFKPLYLVEARRMPEERKLRLTWEDGHQGEYEYDYLRGYCPCASCQGHGAGPVEFRPPSRPVDLEHIEPVGHYAISFRWSDGHATGIYRYEFLRRLCPCPVCARDLGQPVPAG
jgi:DUF971 family protein